MYIGILFPVVASHCSDSEGTWQRPGCDWVMRVSAKVVAALCFTPPCQVIWTSQSVFLFAMRCGAGAGDKSIFLCVFPSSDATIKYHLHFRLIRFRELWSFLTILFCVRLNSCSWIQMEGSRQRKVMDKMTKLSVYYMREFMSLWSEVIHFRYSVTNTWIELEH